MIERLTLFQLSPKRVFLIVRSPSSKTCLRNLGSFHTVKWVKVTHLCPALWDPMKTVAYQAPLSMEFSRQEYSGSAIWQWASRLPEEWGNHSDSPEIFCGSGLGVCWSCPPSISQSSGTRSYLNSRGAKKGHLAMCPWRREIPPPCNDRQMLHHHFLK